MLNTDMNGSATPSERLGRLAKPAIGKAPAGAPEMSVGLARRLKARNAANGGLAGGESVAAEKPAAFSDFVLPASELAVAPEPANTDNKPVGPGAQVLARLEAIEARLGGIATSAEFTEAYVSAGLTRQVSAMIAKEFALVDALASQRQRHRSRMAMATGIIAALVALLVAESQLELVAPASEIIGGWLGNAVGFAGSLVERGAALVRGA